MESLGMWVCQSCRNPVNVKMHIFILYPSHIRVSAQNTLHCEHFTRLVMTNCCLTVILSIEQQAGKVASEKNLVTFTYSK